MSHEREMLAEAAAGVMGRQAAPDELGRVAEGFDPALWDALEELGFTLVSVPEEAGGSGGSLGDAATVLRVAGRTAARVPLAETALLGGWLLASAGLPVPAGPITVVAEADDLVLSREDGGWRLSGSAVWVPWASCAGTIAVLADGYVAALDPAGWTATAGANMAGEPRDDVLVRARLDDAAVAPAPPGVDAAALHRRGALARAIAMSGALDRVLELTIAYAREREQFGRPIGRFQAIQQYLAELAGEATATAAAVEAAVTAEEAGPAPVAVAAAKVRAGLAAGRGAPIAHQVHGAIGATDEHELHLYTRRLWSWRDEFGSETEWSIDLGRRFAAQGPDGIWPAITQEVSR